MKLLQEIQLNAAGLKTDWRKIESGGPGSGRHPGFSQAQEDIHNKLTQSGFGLSKQGVYAHPSGHVAAVQPSGKWRIAYKDTTDSNPMHPSYMKKPKYSYANGSGVAALSKHLDTSLRPSLGAPGAGGQYYDGIESGGPGSGRHPVEGYGVKGLDNDRWRKQFKSSDHLAKWADKNDAAVHGMRHLEDGEIPQHWKSKGYSAPPTNKGFNRGESLLDSPGYF